MKKTQLYDRILGAYFGAAIGDAMGGPLEFMTTRQIRETYGQITSFPEYSQGSVSPQGPWKRATGAVTGDTRLADRIIQASLDKGRPATKGDLAEAVCRIYFTSGSELERSFFEEFAMAALYQGEKEAFGGNPVNSGVMSGYPYGLMFPGSPELAFHAAFSSLYWTTGYGRYAGAIAASAVAQACIPDTTPTEVIETALMTAGNHKRQVEGHYWSGSDQYRYVGSPCESLIVALLEAEGRNLAINEYMDVVKEAVEHPFGADASETLAVAFGAVLAGKGHFMDTISAAVSYGKDADSYGSCAGAIVGAMTGARSIPSKLKSVLHSANPNLKFEKQAEGITGLVLELQRKTNHTKQVIDELRQR